MHLNESLCEESVRITNLCRRPVWGLVLASGLLLSLGLLSPHGLNFTSVMTDEMQQHREVLTNSMALAADQFGKEMFEASQTSGNIIVGGSSIEQGKPLTATGSLPSLVDTTPARSHLEVNKDTTQNPVEDPRGIELDPGKVRLGDPREKVGSSAAEIPVPFYVYEGPDFDWITECPTEEDTLGKHKLFKHGNDAWFAEQVQYHPWRVKDPEKAMLFVVPVMITWSSRKRRCGTALSSKKVNRVSEAVLASPWYKRRKGADHLVVSTDFRIYMSNSKFLSRMFPGFIWGVQLNTWRKKLQASCAFAVPMNSMLPGTLGPLQAKQLREQSSEAFDKRPHPFYFKGQIDTRKNYKLRAVMGGIVGQLEQKHPEVTAGGMYIATPYQHGDPIHWLPNVANCTCKQEHSKVTEIGSGIKCINCVEERTVPLGENHSPEVEELLTSNPYATDLPQTKYAFHISGDLPSSNRIFDIFKVGAVPIVSSKQLEMTLPFADTVPWGEMMVRLPTGGNTVDKMHRILAKSAAEPDVAEIRRLNTFHTPDVLWDAEGSHVTTNILLFAARQCLQEPIPYPDGTSAIKLKNYQDNVRTPEAYKETQT